MQNYILLSVILFNATLAIVIGLNIIVMNIIILNITMLYFILLYVILWMSFC
jgi:hypothetical protein